MSGLEILFLSKENIDALNLGLQEIMDMPANLAYQKAREKGIGTVLSYYGQPHDM